MIASAEYAAESGDVMTSSPGPIPSGAKRDRDARRFRCRRRRRARAARGRELALEGFELRAEHEPPALDHACDRRLHGGRVVA